MEIVDLIVKLAKGEELPKRIKVRGEIFLLQNTKVNYFERIYKQEGTEGTYLNLLYVAGLNQKVEVLDDEKEFEEIEEMKFNYQCDDDEKILVNFDRHREYINSLLRNQKKIIERLNNENNK